MTSSFQSPARIMLIDDHQTVLWGLQQLINSQKPRMEVVGTASNDADALKIVREVRPDIILLDMDLGGFDSLDLLPTLLENSSAKILILTGIRDTSKMDEAVLRGARGVVRKDVPAEILLRAIEKVHAGEVWLDRQMTGRVFQKQHVQQAQWQSGRAKFDLLTAKEREVVSLVVSQSGAPNKEIAKTLFISEHTLRNHLTSIYQKLGVSNRIKLYVFAIDNGFKAD